jgi:RHS repeat-associated protein
MVCQPNNTCGLCGNGFRTQGEACDDGNFASGDGCSATCTVEPGWSCLDESCVLLCSNGLLNAGEGCDDGNAVSGDGCTDSCAVEPGYVCTGQPSECRIPACGDGFVDAGEACDDGAENSDTTPDACRTTCELAACGDGIEDAGEVCDWGPQNGTLNGCTMDCLGYADATLSNGENADLQAIPNAVALLTSITDSDLICLTDNIVSAHVFESRLELIQGYDFVVGAVEVLAEDTLVADPIAFYGDGSQVDGRTLVYEVAPYLDVLPGQYLVPAGTPVLHSLHGASFTGGCPCSTGGSSRVIGCEGSFPEIVNPDPCGNPYADPTQDRIVAGREYCPAEAPLRTDFGNGRIGSCRSSCLVAGSARLCTEHDVNIDLIRPDLGSRPNCIAAHPQVDRICQVVSPGALGGCPGACEGTPSDICGQLVVSDGLEPPDASCGIMASGVAIAGPDSGCFGPNPDGILQDLAENVEKMSRGQLTLRESWLTCLASPISCANSRAPVPPPGQLPGIIDGTEVTLSACEAGGGRCTICALEGLGKGCWPVAGITTEVPDPNVIVAPGGMHGDKMEDEGRMAAFGEMARRMRGPDPRVIADGDGDGADAPETPDEPAPEPDDKKEKGKGESQPAGETDPVALSTGELLLEASDFSFPARGVGISFTRHYRSAAPRSGAFGPGWSHVYEERIEPIGDEVNRQNVPRYCTEALPLIRCLFHLDGRGGMTMFVLAERDGIPVFVPGPGSTGTISVIHAGNPLLPSDSLPGPKIILRKQNGAIHTFDWMSGVLLSVTDEMGFGVTLGYELLDPVEAASEGAAFNHAAVGVAPDAFGLGGDAASPGRVTRLNQLKLVSLQDAYGRVVKLEYDTYQVHVSPSSTLVRRRRLARAIYENPPHGDPQTLAEWEYTDFNLENDAFLTRATRMGMTTSHPAATPLVTEYEYAHDLFGPGGVYERNPQGAFVSSFGEAVRLNIEQVQNILADCFSGSLQAAPVFPGAADDPFCGSQWRETTQTSITNGGPPGILPSFFSELANNIVRVRRGSPTAMTLELESQYEVDPRRPEFDRVIAQRFGLVPAPVAQPIPVMRDGAQVHLWHSEMPETAIYTIDGPLSPPGLIDDPRFSNVQIPNPLRKTRFIEEGRTLPVSLLSALPLVAHLEPDFEVDDEELPIRDRICGNVFVDTITLNSSLPVGDRQDMSAPQSLPLTRRTEASCASIAARWARDAFVSDVPDPELILDDPSTMRHRHRRRELLAWDLNLACQFVQVVDRRGIVETHAMNFQGQPIAIARPTPLSGAIVVTTIRYNADGHATRVAEPDGITTTWTYPPESSGLDPIANVNKRGNPTAMTLLASAGAGSAAHLELARNESSGGSLTTLTSQTWQLRYDPVFQQLQSVREPNGQVTDFYYDYQARSGNSPWQLELFLGSLPTLTTEFLSTPGLTSTFLGQNLGGAGTRSRRAAGLVLRVSRGVALGDGAVSDVGVRYRLDRTGRLTREARVVDALNPSLDIDVVDYEYYDSLANAETGTLVSTLCCDDGPLAKMVRRRTPSATALADLDSAQFIYDAIGGVRRTISNDDSETAVDTLRDSLGRVILVEDAFGATTTSTFDDRGHLNTVTVEGPAITPLVTVHAAATTGEPLGTCSELGSGACNGFEAFALAVTQAHRDAVVPPTFIGNARWQVVAYDLDDVATRLIDSEGFDLQLTRNSAGYVTERILAAQTTRREAYFYDISGRLLRADATTSAGAVLGQVFFRYDRLGRFVARQTRTPSVTGGYAEGSGTIERVGYDNNNFMTRASVHGSDGTSTRRLLSLSRFHRNKVGGVLLEHSYVANSGPTGTVVPSIANPAILTLDDVWVTSSTILDPLLRTVEVRHEGLTPTTYAYDGFGVLEADGPSIKNVYSRAPRSRSVTTFVTRKGSPDRSWLQVDEFDGRGLLDVSTVKGDDAIERKARVEYDALGRTTSVISADLRAQSFDYDPAGRVSMRHEGFEGTPLRTTQFLYDTLGRLLEEIPEAAPPVEFAYDELGAVVSRTSGGVARTTHRDALGRVFRTIQVVEGEERQFDNAFSFNRVVPYKKSVDDITAQEFTYDGLDRMVEVTDQNLVLPADSSSSTFRESRPAVSSALAWDTLGRVRIDESYGDFPLGSPTLPGQSTPLSSVLTTWPRSTLGASEYLLGLSGESMSFSYDGNGDAVVARKTSPSGANTEAHFKLEGGLWTEAVIYAPSGDKASITRGRDSFGRTLSHELSFGASSQKVRSDVLRSTTGRIVAERRSTQLFNGVFGRSYTYDGLGRIAQERIDANTTATLASFNGFGTAGLVQEGQHPFPEMDNTQEATFTQADALTGLGEDGDGRRHSATHDDTREGVLLQDVSGEAVLYDAFKRVKSTSGLELTYDVFDRLVLAVKDGKEMLRLAYDARGQRILERRYDSIKEDSVDICLQRVLGNVVEETYIDGTVHSSTLHASGLDAPLAWGEGSTRPSQKTYALLQNARGDVIAAGRINDKDVREEQQLDLYGERTIVTQDQGVCIEGTERSGKFSKPEGSPCSVGSVLGRFGIAGARSHPETKLVDMRHRTFAPHIKGFLTKDPLSTVDSHHLYGYAAADPVNLRDPLGLSASAADAGVSVVVAGDVTTITFTEAGEDDVVAPAAPSTPARPAQDPSSLEVAAILRDAEAALRGAADSTLAIAISVNPIAYAADGIAGVIADGEAISKVPKRAKKLAQEGLPYLGRAADRRLDDKIDDINDALRDPYTLGTIVPHVALGAGAGSGRGARCIGGGCTRVCFGAGTPVAIANGEWIPIETVAVGRRVLSRTEGDDDDDVFCETDVTNSWFRVQTLVTAADGHEFNVGLARSPEWVEETVWPLAISIPDLGIEGTAQLLNVGPIALEEGPGCVVTMTVSHLNSSITDIVFDGDETIRTTAFHPFWSIDRNEWVPAGELARGEQVNSIGRPLVVTSVDAIDGVELVYNFEVEKRHTYFVGELGAWVHNTGCGPKLPSLDRTGKVHGDLPRAQDLKKILREDLQILSGELKTSVRTRIQKNKDLGHDKAHAERQGAEQRLIRQIDKYLGDSE